MDIYTSLIEYLEYAWLLDSGLCTPPLSFGKTAPWQCRPCERNGSVNYQFDDEDKMLNVALNGHQRHCMNITWCCASSCFAFCKPLHSTCALSSTLWVITTGDRESCGLWVQKIIYNGNESLQLTELQHRLLLKSAQKLEAKANSLLLGGLRRRLH